MCSLKHSFECNLKHSIGCSLEHSIECSLEHSIDCSFEHSVECSLEHSVECNLEHSIECSFEHSLESSALSPKPLLQQLWSPKLSIWPSWSTVLTGGMHGNQCTNPVLKSLKFALLDCS